MPVVVQARDSNEIADLEVMLVQWTTVSWPKLEGTGSEVAQQTALEQDFVFAGLPARSRGSRRIAAILSPALAL